MRTLDEVLKDLKEAEKEFADKCLEYGIIEKNKRKKKEDDVIEDNSDTKEKE